MFKLKENGLVKSLAVIELLLDDSLLSYFFKNVFCFLQRIIGFISIYEALVAYFFNNGYYDCLLADGYKNVQVHDLGLLFKYLF